MEYVRLMTETRKELHEATCLKVYYYYYYYYYHHHYYYYYLLKLSDVKII
jgi:hypothetical protein